VKDWHFTHTIGGDGSYKFPPECYYHMYW